jgi:two-component system OmpR family sensor kinase
VAIQITLVEADGSVVLTVHDDGPGIDPADVSRIFQPFYRSDPSRARSSGGAGLGLAIVAAIVGAHGGTVEAVPGPGATFVVRLPGRDQRTGQQAPSGEHSTQALVESPADGPAEHPVEHPA